VTRNAGAIIGELKALHSLQADAQVQLTSVRIAKAGLDEHEDSLLLAISGRSDKIDRLLDEYRIATRTTKETA
jgi:hypothetical protein